VNVSLLLNFALFDILWMAEVWGFMFTLFKLQSAVYVIFKHWLLA